MKPKVITAVLLILLGINFTNAQVNLNDSIIAYLPLNGNAIDVSGQNNNATTTLSGVYPNISRQGIPNQALFFNGEHEQGLLDFGTPLLNGRTQLTVSMWFNITNLLNAMSIFGQDNLFEIAFYTGPNRLSIFHPTSGTTNVSLSSTLNTWQHLAITTTSTQMRIYLNGILMSTINGNHVIGTNTTNTRIGGNVINQSNNSFFRGAIDELRIYNQILNNQEIEILSASSSITILPLNLNNTELCAGKSYALPFMFFGSGIQNGNIFTAQLSDENGNFSQPYILGTKLSTNNDTINITIPDFVPTGSNYRIRIVSSFPQITSNTSIQTYTVNNPGDGWTTLKRNRLLWYQFNTNSADSSGNGSHATLSGGASYGADRFGNPVGALQLNGVSAFASAPSGVWFNGPFSVSCWVRPNSITNWARLFDFGNGSANDNVTATLFQGTTNRQQAETYIGGLSTGFALTNSPGLRLNQWNHYLVQFDGTTIRIYIDGVLAASANSGIPKFITRLNCWIGRSNWAADAFSNASFDDFMLFNRALTLNEIQALANDGLIIHNPIPCTGNMLQLNAPLLPGATYQWNGPNGFSSSLRQPLIANLSNANSGNYQLIIKQGLCDSLVTTKLITINNLAVQPNITFNSLPPALNTGSTPISLSATPTGGTFFGNGISGSSFNPGLAGDGEHIVLYSVLNASGCYTNRADTTIIFPSYPITNTSTTACNGGFYDAEGPNQNYSSNQSIIHTFYSGSNQKLQFNFSSFGLAQGDTLFVFDGADTSSFLIAYYIQNAAPDIIWSKDSMLTFWFKSDGANVGTGWNASFSCMTNPTVVENTSLRTGMHQICNGVLLDPGGTGNYGYGYWQQTIRASEGARLRFEYSQFNVNGNNGGHWLNIYDGPTTASPLIGAYNNFNFPPAVIESSGEYLTFGFDAGNTNAALQSGFSANLNCFGSVIPVIINSNNSVQTCNAVWFDAGGSTLNYPHNSNVIQNFVSTNGNKLRFTFNRNVTQLGAGDSLFVYDGPDTTAQLISTFIQGSNFEPIKSKDSTLTYKFTSNNTDNGRGWQSFVSCVPSHAPIDTFALSSGVRYSCNAIIRDPGGTGNYGYGFWRQTFGSYNGNRIRLNFSELNINGNNGGHWLTIYDGPDATFPVIGSFNEWSWPTNSMVESTGRFLTVELNTNNTNAATRAGFTANLTCTTPILQVINMRDTTIQSCSAVFYDDAGANNPYSINRNITQTFCSDNSQRVQFTFNPVTTELGIGDTLWVYDGSQTNNQLLGVYIQGSTIETLTASATCLTFNFKSNATSQGRGWQALLNCVSNAPTTQQFALSSGVRYTCDAVIRDPGGTGNYGYGFWRQTFGSYNGNRIRLNFSELNINGNNGGHWLTIYDGPDATFPVIGSFNEWSWPTNSMVESTGRFLTVELNTNNTNAATRAGFTANLTCTTPILQVMNMRDTTIQVCSAVFYDQGGATLNYSDNLNQTMTLISSSGLPLQVIFNPQVTQFNTGDTLRIYDGLNINAPLVGIFVSGSILETITSGGTSLTFRFTSNGTLNARGWQGLVSCVSQSTSPISYVMSSGERFTCNGVFTDPGGNGNYPYGTFTQTFTSYSGQRIRAVRGSFAINQFNGGHFLDVYDGNSINAPLIGTYNNGNFPPTALQSTGSSLTFRFRAGNTNAGLQSGFLFNLSCFTGSAVDVGWLNSQVCQGASLQVPYVRNNPVSAGNIYTVQLSDSAGNFGNPVNIGTFNSTDSIGNILATIPSNTIPGTNYRIRVTTSNPIANGASSPNAITINSIPTQPTSINVNGSTNFCFGIGSAQLSIAAQQGITYQWLRNDTAIGSNSTTITANLSGVYRVKLFGKCDTITSTSSVTINSIATPSIPTITAIGSTQFCSNANVQLSVPSQSNVTYQWKRDTVNIGVNSNVLVANQAGIYSVQLTNSCGTVAAANQINVSITGTPPATPVINSTSTSICPGDSVLLSTTTISNTTYQWRLNGNIISIDTSFIYAKQIGNYTVTAINSCGTALSNALNINNNQTTQISIQPQNIASCSGNTINLNITATGQGLLIYQWFKNNIPLTGAQSNVFSIPSLTPNDTGLYKVRVTGGCGQLFSNEVRVSITQSGVWLGTINSVWTNTANWSCPVIPDSNSQVTIFSNALNMPALTQTVNVGNLIIQNGATLLLNHSNARLNIYGNLILNGPINHMQGWIGFKGNSRQIIPGSIYHKIEINNPLSVELGGQVSVQDTLLITNGKVILNNFNLILSGITGRIEGYNSNRYIQTNGTGNLTIQQIGTGARAGNVIFPIGRLNYNPAVIQNTGIADAISMRLLDSVHNQYNGFIPQGNALVSTAVSKTWLISEGVNGGSNINLSLQWNAIDELTAFSRTNCFIAQFNSNTWTRQSPMIALGTNPYVVLLNNITQLNRPFGVGSGNVLPVQLIRFNGKLNNNHIALTWITASERNNNHYTVIRKNDGIEIGMVPSLSNTSSTKTYNMIDHHIDFTMSNYSYELWQTDLDGRTTQIGETVVSIAKEESMSIRYYPNPTRDLLNIEIPENNETTEMILIDALGKEVYHKKVEKNQKGIIKINIEHLNAGIYTLRINEMGYKVIKR